VTQLVVGARIDAATSETADGNLVSDLSVPIARLARDGATLHLAVIDGDGRIVRANAAFAHSAGGDPIGRMLASLLTPASGELLDANVARGERSAFTIQLTPAKADPVSLRVFVQPRVPGFALVGEPPWEDHRALEAQLISLNAELAILSRERVRQARLLEKANHDLQESHWHLKKVSEVLPMCMACREVKTGPDSWEDVAAFLMRSSDFLSHGYCARCAEKIAHDVEGGP